jgi:uncharacterized membrane protein
VTVTVSKPVGFIGLGSMGEPMARNMVKVGTPLLVWNRSPSKSHALGAAGAIVATDAGEVFACSDVIILMLADGIAIDTVLARASASFDDRVQGHTVINMATVAPHYSKALDAAIRAAGGRYVEAPVSGSRKPAEAGSLVAMLAGEPEDAALYCTDVQGHHRMRPATGRTGHEVRHQPISDHHGDGTCRSRPLCPAPCPRSRQIAHHPRGRSNGKRCVADQRSKAHSRGFRRRRRDFQRARE